MVLVGDGQREVSDDSRSVDHGVVFIIRAIDCDVLVLVVVVCFGFETSLPLCC